MASKRASEDKDLVGVKIRWPTPLTGDSSPAVRFWRGEIDLEARWGQGELFCILYWKEHSRKVVDGEWRWSIEWVAVALREEANWGRQRRPIQWERSRGGDGVE